MDKIRSVNLGGWFVLEKWIKPSLFNDNGVTGNDETKFCNQVPNKEEILYNHYKTWITRDDIVWLKEKGINLVRIPIPWWLFGEGEYVRSVKHIDDALDMISEVGMDFMLDLHTAPGCQNAFDNGGIEGVMEWHKEESNLEKTIQILEKVAARYKDYPRFHSIQVLNEPHYELDLDFVKEFHLRAYKRLRVILPERWIVFCNSFRLTGWEDFFKKNDFHKVILDTHIYQCFGDYHLNHTIPMHEEAALSRAKRLAEVEKYVPVIVGEWSLGLRKNKTITEDNFDEAMTRYASAQIQGMNKCSGYIFWNYKTEDPQSGWNFRSLIERGIINLEEYLS